MKNLYEKYTKNNFNNEKIEDELQEKLGIVKCKIHDEIAKFIIYENKFKAELNCCEDFDNYLNNEADKIIKKFKNT